MNTFLDKVCTAVYLCYHDANDNNNDVTVSMSTRKKLLFVPRRYLHGKNAQPPDHLQDTDCFEIDISMERTPFLKLIQEHDPTIKSILSPGERPESKVLFTHSGPCNRSFTSTITAGHQTLPKVY